ncbi:class I adenylate-forming enzyme family protein [Rhodococcoides fascians]|uniref:class I adenylate-forming enzyme family protein n=1 Tax=Rhodococcoides fascians TaxID=1828 RepID=UPI0005654968|nr:MULTISPECIES: class I adenylate-forming enzyme family protein [Rhodococcus]OZF03167.1 acyl--CoA ligase [Rhodococcus sp. 15-1189-1-1a]OZF16970.1 acyl--CoA ligase [Rhodococcus sp. 14-2686-1-2]
MPGPAPQHRAAIGRATIGDQLRRHARTQPDKTAFISYDAAGARVVTTYADLDTRANRFANLLLDLGVGHGDRVASMARNSVDVVVAYYGTLKVGAAFTGINVLYRGPEVKHQLEHAEPTVIVADPEFLDVIESVKPDSATLVGFGAHYDELTANTATTEPDVDMDENDVAMVIYTSGTEAAPKGVMIPHRNFLISTAPAWSWGLRTGPEDTWLFVMPFHTIAGLGSMTTLTLMGATLVLPATADPTRSLQIIADENISVIAQTPTFYLALAREASFGPSAVGQVRRCLTYGGQVSPHTITAWAQAAPEAIWGTYWGQSELSQLGSVGWFTTLDDIPGGDASWIGKPVTHLEIKVVDAEGNEAEIGELLCRTPSVMLGYFKDEAKTADAFADGWVHTGDMVRIDADGNLFFYDRMKDMIKSGGMNVSSQEVERALHAHPDVLRAAVVGMPDPYWSEAVTAFVIAAEGSTPDPVALIEHCRTSLASYKAPKAVHVIEELPVDAQGKILKRELRKMSVATEVG